jgi:hypothetical protein
MIGTHRVNLVTNQEKETYSVFAQNIVGIFSGGGKTKSKVDMPSIAACISHLDNLFN